MRRTFRYCVSHFVPTVAVGSKSEKKVSPMGSPRSSSPLHVRLAGLSTAPKPSAERNVPSATPVSPLLKGAAKLPSISKASVTPPHRSTPPSKIGNSSSTAKVTLASTSSTLPLRSSIGNLPLSASNNVLSPSQESTSRFSELVSIFKSSAEMLTELDESTMDVGKKASAEEVVQEKRPAEVASPQAVPPSTLPHEETEKKERASVVLSCKAFSAAITCPKKFFLLQYRPDLLPRETVGEAVRYDDSAAFSELALRWDRLQFGSKAILIDAVDFDEAKKQTEKVILDYFAANAALGEQAPTLTLHRPAFAGPCAVLNENERQDASSFGVSPKEEKDGLSPRSLVLRARPLVVRYRPKDNQWVILLAHSVIDPLSNPSKASQCLQRIHFAMRAFRNWVTQPHIPITIRKRFVAINLAPEGMKGGSPSGSSSTESRGEKGDAGVTLTANTTPLVAPIDVKRSGVLHIRQYFPGPVSVLDCDPQKLVKFIQRAPLEDLLQEDCKAISRGNGSGGGALDCSQLYHSIPLHPVISHRYREMLEAAGTAFPGGKARSSRSLKKRDTSEKVYFEHQQELLSSLLTYYVPDIIRRCEDPIHRQRWMAFSCNEGVDGNDPLLASPPQPSPSLHVRGLVRKAKDKKALAPLPPSPSSPAPPCFSEHLGAHCAKGEVCPFFVEGKCLPKKVENPLAECNNHLFTLPSTPVTRKVAWWSEGLRSISDVLKEHSKGKLKLSAPQLRYAQSVISGKIALNPAAIDSFFQQIRYPLFILDFEATAYAVPPYRKVVAYQSIPFQFSLDVFQKDILTETPKHYDFLHFGKGYSPNQDPRRACINELMRIVKVEREKKRLELLSSPSAPPPEVPVKETVRRGRGRPAKSSSASSASSSTSATPGGVAPYDGCFLAHFAAFEKSCLEKLGLLEEMYKEDIKGFHFLDTLELFKKGFVHPNAHGSNSLKKILPAVCPAFQYGVFGGEPTEKEKNGQHTTGTPSSTGKQDEQQGENVMGLYRIWHHHEGGDSIRELLKRSSRSSSRVPYNLSKAEREKIWTMLRIQLLEYCSLDTKAIYEVMREIWRKREEVERLAEMGTTGNEDRKGINKSTPLTVDKNGWVWVEPSDGDVTY